MGGNSNEKVCEERTFCNNSSDRKFDEEIGSD